MFINSKVVITVQRYLFIKKVFYCFLCLVILGFIFNNNSLAAETNAITLVSPDPLKIFINRGVGEVNAIFKHNKGYQLSFHFADAVGTNNTISQSDFKIVGSVDTILESKDTVLINVKIRVETKQQIEFNNQYNGKIFVSLKKESSNGVADNSEIPISDFALIIKDATDINFTLSSEDISSTLLSGQPDERQIVITNTGKEKINKITFSSVGLFDSESKRLISFPPDEKVVDIEPGEQKNVSFKIPQPQYAGAYAGSLNITADNQKSNSKTLTITTRGPNWGGWKLLPFLLFSLVLLAGYLLSVWLDDWFENGGVNRARAKAILLSTKEAIESTLQDLDVSLKTIGLSIEDLKIKRHLEQEIAEIERFESRPKWLKTSQELITLANRMQIQPLAVDIFYLTVGQAIRSVVDNKKVIVVKELDKVALPTTSEGLENYRRDLKLIVENNQSSNANEDGTKLTGTVLDLNTPLKRIELLISTMNIVRWIVVVLFVFLSALLARYLPDANFGYATDYINLLIYSFGLTTAGTKILSKVKAVENNR